jgi:hypothetical protein
MRVTTCVLLLLIADFTCCHAQDPIYDRINTEDYTISTDTSDLVFDNEAFLKSIEGFEKQRAIGKSVQLASIVGMTVLAATATKSDSGLKSGPFFAAGGLYVVGFNNRC